MSCLGWAACGGAPLLPPPAAQGSEQSGRPAQAHTPGDCHGHQRHGVQYLRHRAAAPGGGRQQQPRAAAGLWLPAGCLHQQGHPLPFVSVGRTAHDPCALCAACKAGRVVAACHVRCPAGARGGSSFLLPLRSKVNAGSARLKHAISCVSSCPLLNCVCVAPVAAGRWTRAWLSRRQSPKAASSSWRSTAASW